MNHPRFGHWHHWDRFRHDQHFVRTTVVYWAGGWPLAYYYPYSGSYYYVEPTTAYAATPPVASSPDQINFSYYDLGRQWGQSLLGSTSTYDQFVDYLRDYIVSAPEIARDEFRRGFEAGYGANSTTVFDQAFDQADD